MKKVLIFISWMHLDLSSHNAVHAWQQYLVFRNCLELISMQDTIKEQTPQLVALMFPNYLP